MLNRMIRLSAIVATLGLIGVPAGAVAEGPSQSPEAQSAPTSQPAPEAPEVDASEAEVKEFARVYVETAKLKQKYQQKMMQAEDEQSAKQIRSEAQTEIRGVVEDSSLSMERYSNIAKATSADEELNERIVSEIKKLQGAGGQQSEG